jgi:hypothetical protein
MPLLQNSGGIYHPCFMVLSKYSRCLGLWPYYVSEMSFDVYRYGGACFLLFNRLNDELLSLIVAVFRSIWLRRNKIVFEEQFSSPLKVFT